MLRDEVARYTELSGNDGVHTPIGIIGAYLDGWEQGRKALIDEVKAEIEKEENIWYHDCEPENDWKKFDVIRVDTVLDILDNIGKTESEET